MVRPVHGVLLFFLLLYLLFPTSNSTIDAWYYAGCVKHAQDLFLPHHLLYNALGYGVFQLMKAAGLGVDALVFLKVFNALLAVGCLWVLSEMLSLLRCSDGRNLGWVLVAGASFGVWRFATENEVYLLPILLSLGASYFWIRYLQSKQMNMLVLSGFLAALACLFHQIQVFWWLGLLLGTWWGRGGLKAAFAFALPALLVPLVYVAVLVFAEGQPLHPANLMAFVLHDFYSGTAHSKIGLSNFLLTGINFVRTFFQVHGLMLYLVNKSWLWFLPGLISSALLIWALARRPLSELVANTTEQRLSGRVHLLILLMHLAFAWFAVGNAEFMVMVPFLLPLLGWPSLSSRFLKRAGAALLIWNFCYGIFPAWHYRFSASDALVRMVRQHPDTLYVLKDAVEINNRHFYHFAIDPAPNVAKPPSLFALKAEGTAPLDSLIRQQLSASKPVLTDCLRKPAVISRSSMLLTDTDSAFFAAYHVIPADSFATFYGWQYLHQVRPK